MNYHVGDVGPLEADALLDLARAGVRFVERARRGETEREIRDEASVRMQEAQRTRLRAGDLPHHAYDHRLVLLDLARGSCLRERLEVRLHAGDLRHGAADRRLELLGDVVRLL